MTLFTLTTLSVDRLLAPLLRLRYWQVVTLRRTYTIIFVLWILSTVCSSTYFWNPFVHTQLSGTLSLICLVTSIFSYTKILITLRHNQNQVHNHISQGQRSQAIVLNTGRYKQAVYSALWVQVALVVCLLCAVFYNRLSYNISKKRGMPSSVWLTWQFTASLVYLNSLLNPLLYCWRIREIR